MPPTTYPMRSARVRFSLVAMPRGEQFSGPGISGIVALFLGIPPREDSMKRALVAAASLFLLSSCASQLTREQSLVNKAVDAMGGADRLAALQSVSAKGTVKQW